MIKFGLHLVLLLNTKEEASETYELTDNIRSKAKDSYEGVTLIGNSINAHDLESSFTSDNLIITLITIFYYLPLNL